MKSVLFFFRQTFSCLFSFGQNEASKWHFGNQAALDFMSSPPLIPGNNAMNSMRGSASVADGAGNLLFYTDVATIWNQNHVSMANGTGLIGNNNITPGGR